MDKKKFTKAMKEACVHGGKHAPDTSGTSGNQQAVSWALGQHPGRRAREPLAG